jgi:hypothetical protein
MSDGRLIHGRDYDLQDYMREMDDEERRRGSSVNMGLSVPRRTGMELQQCAETQADREALENFYRFQDTHDHLGYRRYHDPPPTYYAATTPVPRDNDRTF